jgi:serine/threonine protein kinase
MNLCPHCFGEVIADNACPFCGYINGDNDFDEHALPLGTSLSGGRYTVGGILTQSGFGITYFGYDNESKSRVAILEYFPESFAERTKSGDNYSVCSQKGETAESFEKGLRRFENEAKRLSRFENLPGFVSVKNLFEGRGTAYVVMDFIDGELLSAVIHKRGGKLSEKITLNLFLPIIKTLGIMHKTGFTHRDITPDNILVQKGDGKLVLIDLGASLELTEEGGDMRTTVAMLRYGYAAEELYDRTRVRQGSWTDVYGIASTMIHTMTGKIPSDVFIDKKKSPFADMTDTVSETVRNALIRAIEPEIKNRTRTMEQLYSELTGIPAAAILPENENKTKYSDDIHILEHPHSASIVKTIPIANFEGLVIGEQIINQSKTDGVIAFSHEKGGEGAGFTVVYAPGKSLKISYPIKVRDGGRGRFDLYGSRCEILIDLSYGEDYGQTIIRRTENGKDASGFLFSYNHFTTEKFSLSNFFSGEKDGDEFLYDGDTVEKQTYVDGKTSPKDKKTYALSPETEFHKDYIFGEKIKAVRYSETLSFGSISYHNGDYYRGLISDKKAAGPGVIVYADGDVFIGQFSGDLPDGYGLYIKPEGECLFVKYGGGRSEKIGIGQIGEQINLLQSPYLLFLDSIERLIAKGQFEKAAAELQISNVSFTDNTEYYWSKLKIHLRTKTDKELERYDGFIQHYSEFKNAFKYADEKRRRYYEGIVDRQVGGNETYRKIVFELIPAGKFDKAKDEMMNLQNDLADYSEYWWTLLKINLKTKTDEEMKNCGENITAMLEYINANKYASMERKKRYLNIAKSILSRAKK